ncbi:alpha/beta fold hydrolase, partial [Undibacterium pigrum]
TELAQIWAGVLKLDRVGRHDHFFELGGHSLLVARMIQILNNQGITASVLDVFQNPTLNALAEKIKFEKKETEHKCIKIKEGDGKKPLFLVYESHGLDLYFPVLAKHIDNDIPVYGLPGIPLGEKQLSTIEEQAKRLVDIIQEIQPEGPYRIAGWSFGGLLAYEVASRLLGRDETIEFLGLIDTYAPLSKDRQYFSDSPLRELISLCEPIGSNIDEFKELRKKVEEDEKYRKNTLNIKDLLIKVRELGILPENLIELNDDEAISYVCRLHLNNNAQCIYLMHSIPIQVHLFAASNKTSEFSKGDLESYNRLLKFISENQVELEIIPGDHRSIIENDIEVSYLGKCISDAIKKSGKSKTSLVHQYDPVFTLQNGNRCDEVLICVPGAGGNAMIFKDLIEHLPKQMPIFALQPRGVTSDLVPHENADLAAKFYVNSILEKISGKKVHILGHSFGGWVGLEMAREFKNSGTAVSSLTILDSKPPTAFNNAKEMVNDELVLQKLVEILQLQSNKGRKIYEQASHEEGMEEKIARAHDILMFNESLPKQTKYIDFKRVFRSFKTALNSDLSKESRYNDEVLLVLAENSKEDNHESHVKTLLGWRKITPKMTFIYASGNHLTMLNAVNSKNIASLLVKRLDKETSNFWSELG